MSSIMLVKGIQKYNKGPVFGGGPPKCGCEAENGLFFIEFFLLTWYETEMSCLTGLFGYSGFS